MDTKLVNKNFSYFKKQLPSLMKEHLNKIAVVKDQKIVEIFDELKEADQFVIQKNTLLAPFLFRKSITLSIMFPDKKSLKALEETIISDKGNDK